MKKWFLVAAAALVLAGMLLPTASYTEDRDTVLLARAIYALAGSDSYEAKLAVGSVAMNRVADAWFGNTLEAVLNEQHQFPIGRRYDSDSLAAAHAVLSGQRALPANALYYHPLDAAEPWHQDPVKTAGNLAFYTTDGNW